jgi:hypothetical protein
MRPLTTAASGVLLAACIAAPAHGAPTDSRLPVARHTDRALPHTRERASWSPNQPITSCNPLGRSRGPGAGAGLL